MSDRSQTVEAEIRQLAQEWMEATARRDAAALDRFLADEFLLVAARGLSDKPAWLHAALHLIEVTAFRYDDVRIRLYGDVAVMHSHWTQQATMAGQDWSGEFRLTDVWVRRAGRWQVVARHLTQVSGIPGAAAARRP